MDEAAANRARDAKLLVYAALAAQVTPDQCAEAARQLREGPDWPYPREVIDAAVRELEQRASSSASSLASNRR